MARRYGAHITALEESHTGTKLWIVPHIDRQSGQVLPIGEIARAAHAQGAVLIVEASLSLAGRELRVDEWAIDACVAGVDYAVGAPSGMALVTYSPAVEDRMQARKAPPRTSYLDLLQLQAYWSPERLNHHTAPTSLVYGLREALRLVQHAGLTHRWQLHRRTGQTVRAGLQALGLDIAGEPPYAIVRWPANRDEASLRRALLNEFGVYVRLAAPRAWCIGLLGADARLDTALRVLTALEAVLHERGAVRAARQAFDQA
jgi:aspartate aminotransferase-like enzyme